MNIGTTHRLATALIVQGSASASDLWNTSETARPDTVSGEGVPASSRDIPWNRLFGDAGAFLAQSVVAVREASLVPIYITVVSALTLASGAYVFYRAFRVKEEWDVRYRPFGPLQELNELVGVESPTLQGALQILGKSLDPRKKPRGEIYSLHLNPETPSPADEALDSIARTFAGMTGFRVVSGEDLARLAQDTELNRHGVTLARRFIEALRAGFDEIGGESYLKSTIRLVKRFDHFLRGLNRMAERDPRYGYYRMMFGHLFDEMRGIIVSAINDYVPQFMRGPGHQIKDFDRYYFLERLPLWRRMLDDIETSILRPMEDGSVGDGLRGFI